MSHTLAEDAHAIILPAFSGMALSPDCKKFLANGGVSVLLGETRAEYVGRQMTQTRRQSETPESFHTIITQARALSGDLLVAVDQEIGGICRLHDLVPAFPNVAELPQMAANELEDIAFQVGRAAAELGVNCFLGPILDLVTGQNPWLKGRTYSIDPGIVGRVSSAYVRGVQRAGIAATAKHFPGFHNIPRDPAVDPAARVTDPAASFENGFIPFQQVIAENVELVMVGPAIVQAFDPDRAALRSKSVVDLLVKDLAYKGIVLADDLDAKATLRGDTLAQVTVDAVNAGCDFLLLGDVDTHLSDCVSVLVNAALKGEISREALAVSAQKIRTLARKYQKPV